MFSSTVAMHLKCKVWDVHVLQKTFFTNRKSSEVIDFIETQIAQMNLKRL